MKLEKKRYEDVVILRFVGELDTFNLRSFQERFEKWVAAGERLFILDVRLLKFINSTAIGYLTKATRLLGEQGGEAVLASPSKFMRRMLTTTGLDRLFGIFESVEDALLHLKKGVDAGILELADAEYDETLTGSVPVLFRRKADASDAPPNQVGRIITLYPDGLLFRYEPVGDTDPVELDLQAGTVLKLKFRQPFVVKEHYFEMDTQVLEVNEIVGDSGDADRVLTVRVKYQKVADDDRALLDQFVRDQETWRREVHG